MTVLTFTKHNSKIYALCGLDYWAQPFSSVSTTILCSSIQDLGWLIISGLPAMLGIDVTGSVVGGNTSTWSSMLAV